MFFGARRLFSVNFGQKTRKRTLLGSPGGPFRVFLAFFGQKTPKQTGMTSLGFPGLSSQSVSGFFGPFRPENPETDWDDKPGLPRRVIPVRFRFFLYCLMKKTINCTSNSAVEFFL